MESPARHCDHPSEEPINMSQIRGLAAHAAGAELLPFRYDPGNLGSREVEIGISHCGICHSDLSMLDNEWGMSQYPFVPGHEVTGTVVALGEGAKGLKIGQRVGLGSKAPDLVDAMGKPPTRSVKKKVKDKDGKEVEKTENVAMKGIDGTEMRYFIESRIKEIAGGRRQHVSGLVEVRAISRATERG